MSSETAVFEPSKYLTQISGRDYLEVKWRLLWLRTEHPDAAIDTELVRDDGATAVFRARVSLPTGGSATGWGSESADDFGDYLEKCECCDLRTEILTRWGFRRYDQLAVGDDVAAYDLAADRLIWTPVQRVTVHERRDICRLGGAWFEAFCTFDHSWAVATDDGRHLVKAHALRTNHRLVLAAPAPDGDSDITPDEAATLGWLITDGSIWERDGTLDAAIYQSKPAHVEPIRALVGTVARETVGASTRRVFPNSTTERDCLPGHVWHLPARFVRPLIERAGLTSYADLPALPARLSAAARQSMLDAMMAADGDTRGYFGKKRKAGVQECWQVLATLLGQAVGPTRNGDIFAVQRLKSRRFVSCSNLSLDFVEQGPVWCPTTAYGTWVARLPNGQVTITGNTKALGRALAALGYGTQFCADFDFGAQQGRVVDSPVDLATRRPRGGSNGSAEPATERQVRAIYAIGRAGHLADGDIVARCQAHFGCPPEQLDRRGASTFIDLLKQELSGAAAPVST